MSPSRGQLISVPLNGSWCLGVVLDVARGVCVTAFLGRECTDASDPECKRGIDPSETIAIVRHGSLGFEDNWKILGSLEGFNREDWPPLHFHMRAIERVVELDPKTLYPAKEVPDIVDTDAYPKFSMMGDKFVQTYLRGLIGMRSHEQGK
jgi:hypothetical protein